MSMKEILKAQEGNAEAKQNTEFTNTQVFNSLVKGSVDTQNSEKKAAEDRAGITSYNFHSALVNTALNTEYQANQARTTTDTQNTNTHNTTAKANNDKGNAFKQVPHMSTMFAYQLQMESHRRPEEKPNYEMLKEQAKRERAEAASGGLSAALLNGAAGRKTPSLHPKAPVKPTNSELRIDQKSAKSMSNPFQTSPSLKVK